MDWICKNCIFCGSSDSFVLGLKVSGHFFCESWSNTTGSSKFSHFHLSFNELSGWFWHVSFKCLKALFLLFLELANAWWSGHSHRRISVQKILFYVMWILSYYVSVQYSTVVMMMMSVVMFIIGGFGSIAIYWVGPNFFFTLLLSIWWNTMLSII